MRSLRQKIIERISNMFPKSYENAVRALKKLSSVRPGGEGTEITGVFVLQAIA